MVATKESILEAIDALMAQMQQEEEWGYLAALSRIKGSVEAYEGDLCADHSNQ